MILSVWASISAKRQPLPQVIAQTPAQFGDDLRQRWTHTGQAQFHLRSFDLVDQSANLGRVEPPQTDTLSTQIRSEEANPVLGVGIGDRQVHHPIDGHARSGATAGVEEIAKKGQRLESNNARALCEAGSCSSCRSLPHGV